MGHRNHKAVIPVGGYAGCRDFPNAGERLSLTANTATSNELSVLLIDIVADVACFITISPNDIPVVDTAYPILAGVPYRMPVTVGDRLRALTSGATGNLWIHPVKGDIDSEV